LRRLGIIRNPYVLRGLAAVGIVSLLALAGWIGYAWYQSRLPASYNAMDYGVMDYGGGPPQNHAQHPHRRVDTLKGPQTGTPDVRVTLTAEQAEIRLDSGRTVQAWSFDGQVPGPELRIRQDDLVEATLVNKDIDDGVTIHWHGVDVPNAEDGVAGVTQNAVMPGGRYTYRFRAHQVGTFWYHSHQVSSEQVRRGLYGALVIGPRKPPAAGTLDLATIVHDLGGRPVLGHSDEVQRRAVSTGTPVRLRLINSNDSPERFVLSGTPFRVVGIDGTDVNGPTPVEGQAIQVGAGARYDLAFDMPDSAVRLGVVGSDAALSLSADGRTDLPEAEAGSDFDPAGYGRPAATPFDDAHFDRSFEMKIGQSFGFLDGRPGRHWSINGRIFPDTPMYVVRPGDLVKMRIVNDTGAVHPMHLHGHHALVLSRNARPVTGSPWWVDTLNVLANEEYEIAFRAGNPGLWMDHCHNLVHAGDGLTMHVVYEGAWTRFELGDAPGNHPE
jgi:FtsP/CotA-like multicopper oxidase with cupredoxin domain